MAQPAETFDSFDSDGNTGRPVRYNLQCFTDRHALHEFMIGRTKATQSLHEWQTDSRSAAASGTNAQIDGDDAAGDAVAATTRDSNRCQISTKTIVISGRQEDREQSRT